MKMRFVSFGKLLVLGSVVAAQIFASGCSECGSPSKKSVCSAASAAVVSTSTGNCSIDYSNYAAPVAYAPAIVPGSERVISRRVVSTSAPAVASPTSAPAPAPIAVAAPVAVAPVASAPAAVYSVPPVAAPVPMNIARPRTYAAAAPIYYTPGGTPITAYVPGPAVGSQLRHSTGGPVLAEPTISTSLPVRTGDVHYTTGAICNVVPTRGESVVWTSGF